MSETKQVNGSIWHSISTSRIKPSDFICVIEISKGSKSKYELDKETGFLILDRILHTSTGRASAVFGAGAASDTGAGLSHRRDFHAGQW